MRVPILRKPAPRRLSAAGDRPVRAPGQSLAEFALVLPVFMLIVLIGLDFGRLYSGWVTLQQAARIAANFAAVNPDAWGTPGSIGRRDKYQALVASEVEGINCDFPTPAPDPVFPDGSTVGGRASVTLNCNFHLLTPFISKFLPNPLATSASSIFVIRTGFTNSSNCTTTGTCPAAPIAAFGTVPVQAAGTSITTVNSGQTVEFIDSSQHNPTGWLWDFGDGSATSADEFPQHIYTTGASDVTRTVTFTACNFGGCNTTSGTIVVHTTTPAPTADFHWCTSGAPGGTCSPSSPTPLTGPAFIQLSDDSTGTPTSWSWTFGDGGTSTLQNPTHTYASVSTDTSQTITLTATNAFGSNSISKTITIGASASLCRVPTFTGNDPIGHGPNWSTADVTTVWTTTSANWTGGGFSGSIIYTGGTPTTSFKIKTQTPAPTTLANTPCTTTLTLTYQ
jgi:PKD repeat protein